MKSVSVWRQYHKPDLVARRKFNCKTEDVSTALFCLVPSIPKAGSPPLTIKPLEITRTAGICDVGTESVNCMLPKG